MQLVHASLSCQGPRADNQDRLLEPIKLRSGAWLAGIADGVGGAAGGGEAAQLAIEEVSRLQGEPTELDSLFDRITEAIRFRASQDPNLRKMATTLSVILVKDWFAHVAHVGDTRIYHLRASGLKNLTEDQTEVAELVRKGVLTRYQAKNYPRKHVLTSVLSAQVGYSVIRREAVLMAGDRLTLLSDGVYDRVLRRTISEISVASKTVAEFAASLRQYVESAGPSDNYSAIIVEVQT